MTQIISGDTITPSMSERRKGSAIIIGGGFGGLATAIRLQAAGHAVTLVEARERLGGRAYQLKKDGFCIASPKSSSVDSLSSYSPGFCWRCH